jgi:hypothetical protein
MKKNDRNDRNSRRKIEDRRRFSLTRKGHRLGRRADCVVDRADKQTDGAFAEQQSGPQFAAWIGGDGGAEASVARLFAHD